MNASVSKHWTSRVYIFACAALLIVIMYIGFASYLQRASSGLATNWLQSENISIHQGNFLTSTAKLQSMMQASDLLTGFEFFELAPNATQKLLFRSGTTWTNKSGSSSTDFNVYQSFPMSTAIVINFPEQSKSLTLYFYPKVYLWGFTLFTGLLLGLIGLAFWLFRKSEQRLFSRILESQDLTARQVIHDLQSPLTALKIIGSTKTDTLSPDIRQLLVGSTKRIQSITADLNFKYLQTKSALLQETEVISIVRNLYDEKRLQFSNVIFSIEAMPESAFCLGDQALLTRSLSNLLQNASEAAMLSKARTVSVYINSDRVINIEIRDSGPGISANIRDQIFGLGVTTKARGSGLGLYHARKSLNLMGGTVELCANKGEGLCATVRLPILECLPLAQKSPI